MTLTLTITITLKLRHKWDTRKNFGIGGRDREHRIFNIDNNGILIKTTYENKRKMFKRSPFLTFSEKMIVEERLYE